MKKYQAPDFLSDIIDQATYEKWLHRKAMTHVRRDRGRGNISAQNSEYKQAIHTAVIECQGFDSYTKEPLDWSLLSQYDNELSKQHGRGYKKLFALLPSIDHVGDGLGSADFRICAWRTNDSKNDLPLDEFIALCQRVVDTAKNLR